MILGNRLKVLLAGSFISQFLGIALIPIITTLYTPSEYGVYVSILNWALILSPLYFVGLEKAIPAVRPCAQLPLFKRLLIVSLQILLMLFSFILILDISFDLGTLDDYKWFLSLILSYFLSLTVLLGFYFVSSSKVKEDSSLKVAQTSLVLLGQVCGGILKLGGIGLSIIDIIGRLIGIIIFSSKVNLRDTKQYLGLRGLSQYYKFGLPSTMLITLCINLPVILIAELYSEEHSALYFLALKLLLAPAALFSVSIGRLYFTDACNNEQTGKSNKLLFINTLKKLAMIGGAFYFLILMIIPIISNFLGAEWRGIEGVLYILLPLSFIQFLTTPLSMSFTVYKKQQLDLSISLLRFLSLGVISAFCYFENVSFDHYLIYCVIMSIAIYTLSLLISYVLIKRTSI
jgi:O-antigen/teichoic acid export membrane protein